MKAFLAVYGDISCDFDASTCVVFAATHGKARMLASKQLECEFTEITSCKRQPKLDRYAVKGRLSDRDYINEGWSVGCPKCEAMTDEYTARFDAHDEYLIGCEYCINPRSNSRVKSRRRHLQVQDQPDITSTPRSGHQKRRDTMSSWKLKRVRQCAKCPWKVSTDPHEIPNGYSDWLHQGLACTIAEPGRISAGGFVAMACHEHPEGEEAHCVGWLANQLGPGNNIGLRLRMMTCENRMHIQLDGEQHERFEDTLP